MADLSSRSAILVDDGLASGFTMRVAVQAVRNAGAKVIAVAVPTAHYESFRPLLDTVEAIYCANIRRARPFAVADAYRDWRDVSEREVAAIVESVMGQPK
jgi:predicted phosphoribosyltransferase